MCNKYYYNVDDFKIFNKTVVYRLVTFHNINNKKR